MRLAAMAAMMALFAGGCGSAPRALGEHEDGAILFVAGALGDGPCYSGLRGGLASERRPTFTVGWGAPWPLGVFNLQNRWIHESAERRLAKLLRGLLEHEPPPRLVLVGHSAGCGVILGALRRIPDQRRVQTVVLLSPSVSPHYDLAPALARVEGHMHVFHSDRDWLLRWRTRVFGTYDNVRVAAAGCGGFAADALPPELREKLIQHPHLPQYAQLGNKGRHWGPVSRRFVAAVIAPAVF